ncbi:Solute carrier family 22 member 3 [Halotydeus destructor]|nr:Solute carrier family 22 member 3 [Halotydeus destructor]
MIGRFLLAIGAYGRYLTGFMLVMETTGPNVRATKGITCRLGWAIGYFLLPGLGMLFTNFRHLSLALSVPELLWLYWLNKVSESPRWLMATDKPDKAAHIITKAMRVNGKSMVGIEDKLRQLQSNFKKTDEPVVEANLKDLFLWPALRKNTLILMFTWFTTGFVYYGLSLNIGDLGGSLLVNFAIAGILEFPAFGLSVYALEHYGRRNVQALIMFGAALGSIAAIPLYAFDVAHVVRLTLGMFVKFCLACSWNVIYVYSAEVYPTVVRQIGVGSNSAASRIGSAMAPFMKEITQYTHISVTLAIFGVLCLVNAMTILILPETKDQEIPDSIQEAERKYGAK